MFGLSALFAALSRLTRSVNASADLFDAANDRMKTLFAIDGPADGASPALDHRPADQAEAEAGPAKSRNGRAAKQTAAPTA